MEKVSGKPKQQVSEPTRLIVKAEKPKKKDSKVNKMQVLLEIL